MVILLLLFIKVSCELKIPYIRIRNVIILNCEKWKFCFADRAFSCQPNFLFPHCLSCNGSFIITSVSLKEDPDMNWKFWHFMSTENLRGLFEPSVALCQNYGIMICGSIWSKCGYVIIMLCQNYGIGKDLNFWILGFKFNEGANWFVGHHSTEGDPGWI